MDIETTGFANEGAGKDSKKLGVMLERVCASSRNQMDRLQMSQLLGSSCLPFRHCQAAHQRL
eukprot:1152826-Pelagomonas_calceolata.AAC.8